MIPILISKSQGKSTNHHRLWFCTQAKRNEFVSLCSRALLGIAWALLFVGCARNEPPIVVVGADLAVDAGDHVALWGDVSDPDGSVQSHLWEQVSGRPVSIRNAGHLDAEFVAPVVSAVTTIRFRLTATDNSGATDHGEITVEVRPYGDLMASIGGTVRDHSNYAAIVGASVTIRQFNLEKSLVLGEAETNEDGRFSVDVVAVQGRLVVNVEAKDYAPQSAIISLASKTQQSVANIGMVPVHVTQSFVASEGAEVDIEGQRVLELPANAMMTEDGSVYGGSASVAITVLDPSRNPTVMPGDFVSWDAFTQAEAPIESYGAMNVVLKAENGQALQLGNAEQAEVAIPLAAGRMPGKAPPSMPLFFWSNELGYWVEEGEARLDEVSPGKWAYVGAVDHFTTWNADAPFESVRISGCVEDSDGKPVSSAVLSAQGIDYSGTSSATASEAGVFDIEVRPDSELQLVAASGDFVSEALTIQSADTDTELKECLVVLGEEGLSDFPIQIEGESGSVQICVRDHECEDGDAISVDVEGRNVFTGEIVNEWVCSDFDVESGQNYEIELTALNGTGYKGSCSYADINTGEIRVSGQNMEARVWRHREGAGSRARIVVTTAIPQPFTVVAKPAQASVRFVDGTGAYVDGMELPAGEYQVEVSAEGYRPQVRSVRHANAPTRVEVELKSLLPAVGERFRDCPACPEMVVIPPGSFRMGCLSDDDSCNDDERPVRAVRIPRPFALSKHEVTFAAWDACVAAGGCAGHRPEDGGWGRGSRPVINVSWRDAQAYASWLSEETGEPYRLPSESEWEYAARAGTVTKYFWGDHIGRNRANCYRCGSRWDFDRTAPVGSFAPNAFGLHDLHGNVWEWVEDCWNDSYLGAPTEGQPWTSGDCAKRVLRGGSGEAKPRYLRSAFRLRNTPGFRYFISGFRVARTLTP